MGPSTLTVGKPPKCASQFLVRRVGNTGVARSGTQLLLWNKRYDFVSGPPLSLLCCHKNRLNIEPILGGIRNMYATPVTRKSIPCTAGRLIPRPRE
jgi:hypothetical protein